MLESKKINDLKLIEYDIATLFQIDNSAPIYATNYLANNNNPYINIEKRLIISNAWDSAPLNVELKVEDSSNMTIAHSHRTAYFIFPCESFCGYKATITIEKSTMEKFKEWRP